MYPQTYWGKRIDSVNPCDLTICHSENRPSPDPLSPPLGLENAFQKPLEGSGFSGYGHSASLQGPANEPLPATHNLCICLHCASGTWTSVNGSSVSSTATWGPSQERPCQEGYEEF